MSETEATPTKSNAWTDEAKNQFLLRIIAQLRADGKAINWTRFHMDGRTTKSLQNQWSKTLKDIAELECADPGDKGAGTPAKPKATPRKGRAKKAELSSPVVAPGGSDDEDAEKEIKVTPKKRGPAARRGGGKSSAKKPKRADSDEEAAEKDGVKDEENDEV